MLIRITLLCLACCWPLAASALPPEVEADRLAIKAKAALEGKDYAQAVASFEQMEKLNVPLPQSFHYLKGVALNGLRKFGAARRALENYLQISETSGKYYKEALMAYNIAENGARVEPEMIDMPGQDFAIGKYEVTQALWRAVMGSNPSSFPNCDDCPVENVSWDDIQAYLKKLNQLTGQTYRLPTEAEWKYACGVGQGLTYCGSDDLDAVGWYGDNAGERPHPVGQKRANGHGLHDMSGNVQEWLQDCMERCSVRVQRGGSWSGPSGFARADERSWFESERRFSWVGFRVVRSAKTN